MLRSELRTIAAHLRHSLRPHRPPAPTPWSTEVREGPRRIRLSGALREVPGADELVILVHGLGSRPDAVPCLRGAQALHRLGVSSLALSLRGSDLRGEDFYNVALTADLHAALASPALAAYRRVYVIGYSMGGYVSLHLACDGADARLAAVVAVCTPLDLAAAQRHIDSPRAWFFRRRVLRGLVDIYCAVARERGVPTPAERVRRVRTIHEWDRLTIAPRYGYHSPEHYYRELSVVPRLAGLRVPALLVAAREDPIVAADAIEPFLPQAHASGSLGASAHAPGLEVRWVTRAGHLAFPGRLQLGLGPEPGLEAQVLHWARGRAGHSSPR